VVTQATKSREAPGAPLRVLHFVAYYPPQRIGGVGELVAGLHQSLLRRGHDSRVVTSGRGGSERVARIARTRLGWFLGSLLWARRAASCDIVHCQSGEAAAVLLALKLMPGRRARSVVTFHAGSRGIAGAASPYSLEGRRFGPSWRQQLAGRCRAVLHGLLDALALQLADGCNAVSQATAEDVAPGAALPVIHNGVAPLGEAQPPAEELPRTALLFVGPPSHGKRVLALPFVLRAVRRKLPEARLRIAGFAWADAPELRRLCAELGVEDAVECVGTRSRSELEAIYRAAGLLVMPSAYEGLPFVMLEAMQQATPVVACRIGGHPEVIRQAENGLLAPVDDPEALASLCLELLLDPQRAERVSAAGRDSIARRFGLERCADAHLDYYRALAEEER